MKRAWMCECNEGTCIELGKDGDWCTNRKGCDCKITQGRFVPESEYRAMIKYRKAIDWALGVGDGTFPARQEGQGAYWWRSELQKRAGLKWDGKKYVSVEAWKERGE